MSYIPVGNVLNEYYKLPTSLKNKFKREAQRLTIGFYDWGEGQIYAQDLMNKIINELSNFSRN